MAYTDHVGDIVRVTSAVICVDGQVQETTFHYQCVTAAFGSSLNEIITAVDAIHTTHTKPLLHNTARYYGSRLSVIKGVEKWASLATILNQAGTSGSPSMPTQVRPLISYFTQFRGPGARGRMYLFTPVTDYTTTAGLPTAALLPILDTIALAYRATMGTVSGGVWSPVIANRTKPPVITYNSTPITGHFSNVKFATQRKSGAYGKPNVAPW